VARWLTGAPSDLRRPPPPRPQTSTPVPLREDIHYNQARWLRQHPPTTPLLVRPLACRGPPQAGIPDHPRRLPRPR
jgi:hypothetical protein